MELKNNIIEAFFGNVTPSEISVINSGHINTTFKVSFSEKGYIFQKINTQVFNPVQIAHNINEVTEHLKKVDYPLTMVETVPTLKKEDYCIQEGEYWRVLKFIPETQSNETVKLPEQAYHASHCFGQFIYFLKDLKPENIKAALPGFMDFHWRFQQLTDAVNSNPVNRFDKVKEEVDFLVTEYEKWAERFDFFSEIPWRIIHGDAKISNILFKKDSVEPACVIDLDTLMPGPVVYDFSDMVRSYTNLKEEDSIDLEGEIFSWEIMKELIKGFSEGLGNVLTDQEWVSLEKGAGFVTYIQALRFLSDYINGDTYYQTKYEGQNLNRTLNQIALYQSIMASQGDIEKLFKKLRSNF